MGNALRNGASGAQLLAVSPVRGKGESSRLPHSRAEIAEKLFDFDILLACPPPQQTPGKQRACCTRTRPPDCRLICLLFFG